MIDIMFQVFSGNLCANMTEHAINEKVLVYT